MSHYREAVGLWPYVLAAPFALWLVMWSPARLFGWAGAVCERFGAWLLGAFTGPPLPSTVAREKALRDKERGFWAEHDELVLNPRKRFLLDQIQRFGRCPNAEHMAEHACENRHQCWEPCGELGTSEEHVKPGPSDDIPTIDLDALAWAGIKQAASESEWMPPEYMANDWQSDVSSFLRNGPEVAPEVLANAARYEWLRDRLHSAVGGSVHVNDERLFYGTPEPGASVELRWYPDTPVGFVQVTADTLDAAIDEAMSL